MKEPFNLNFGRPRRSNLLLARALLFAVTIALSSSDEDVNVSVKSADIPNRLAAPWRLDKRELLSPILFPYLVPPAALAAAAQAQRQLQTESERSKSSKGGSKSASKGSKKQHSKSKSGKSKSGKSKLAKAKGKSGKGKSGKGKGKGGKSISAKGRKSAKSKAGKSEPEEESEDESSAHSANSHGSQEYIAATSFDGAEPNARTKNAPSPGSEGGEGSVASPSTAEDPDTESATSIMSSNGNLPVEETEGTRSEATATSYDGWVEPSAGDGDGESGENEEVVKMDVDFMDESNINDRDIGGDADAQSNDNLAKEQNNASTETTASSEIPEEEHVDENSVDMPNLHKDLVEVRSGENEDMESEE